MGLIAHLSMSVLAAGGVRNGSPWCTFPFGPFLSRFVQTLTNAYGAPGMDESENLSKVPLPRRQWVVEHPTLRFCLCPVGVLLNYRFLLNRSGVGPEIPQF